MWPTKEFKPGDCVCLIDNLGHPTGEIGLIISRHTEYDYHLLYRDEKTHQVSIVKTNRIFLWVSDDIFTV